MKVSNKEMRLESILLRLRSSDNSGFLTDFDYAQHLLDQSWSVPFLMIILSPLKDIFNAMNYGRPYNALATQYEESRKTCHSVAADTAANDVSLNLVKEEDPEEMSTDDEQKLFDEVEGSFTTS